MHAIRNFVAAFSVLTVFASFSAPGAPPPSNTADIDALVQGLKSSNVGERVGAALSLKKMGPAARGAGPALEEMAKNDPEVALRELAKDCLDAIREPRPLPGPRIEVNLDDIMPIREPRPLPGPRIEVNLDDIMPADPVAKEIEKTRKVVGGDLYSMVTINNKTRGPINYKFRWGKKDWQQVHLNPGERMPHSHKYEFVNEYKSPPFEVQFDRNVTPRNTWIVYRLKRKPSPSKNADFGRQYDFQQSDDNHIILNKR